MAGKKANTVPPTRLLVVDDEADFRSSVCRALTLEGYAVEEAADGLEALVRLREESYNLVILDLSMPRMNGLDLMESLRAGGQTAPPVIMLSAFGDWGSYARALELGVKAFLCKPLGMAELMAAIQRTLAGCCANRAA